MKRRVKSPRLSGKDAAKIAVVCIAYFAMARLGLSLAYEHSSITAVWAPSGIALAALLLGGLRLWPGVALGAFLANAFAGGGLGLLTVTGITLGNTLEAVVGALLLRRVGFRPTLDRVRDVAALVVLAATLSTMVSATFGTISLGLGGIIAPGDLTSAWWLWWLGDMTGDLLIAPVILVLAMALRSRPQRLRPILEGAGLLAALALISVVVFVGTTPLGYLVFPLLIVAALRLGQIGAALSALTVASIAVPFTARGSGPFARELPDTSLLLSQTFVAAAAVTALILGAVTLERTRARRDLEDMVLTRTAQLETRNRQLSEAQELERAKDEVVALVSHDLRTPLTSIRGYTELLLTDQEVLGERSRQYVEVIDRNSGRLLDLVDDLLIVAQHNVGAFSLRTTEAVDLDELIAHEILAVTPEAAGREITLLAGTNTGATVPGDRPRLARMLGNLLSNAVKYSERGGTVELEVAQTEQDAVLRVRDSGPGVPADQQERIFDRFARIRDGVDGAQGFGLGLTIARTIAEAHGGRIGVDSALGDGATFWVELPRILRHPAVDPDRALAAR